MNNHFIQEFSSILEMPVELITDDFRLQDRVEWDSFAYLSTIGLVDRCFNVSLSAEDFKAIRTFSDLNNAISRKLGH